MVWTPFLICLCLGLAASAPTKDDRITIDKDFFDKDYEILEAEHEIVNIIIPLNKINFDDIDEDTTDDLDDTTEHPTLLFVQADIDENGKKTEQGMYIFKKGNVTKLLNNGRDATSGERSSKIAYIGAKDGIYKYDDTDESITKYGTFDVAVNGIAKVMNKDVIYVLTDYNSVYKVSKEGTKKKKVDAIEEAVEIVLDYGENLYYYTKDYKVSVYNETKGVTAVTGLPENDIKYMKLIRPMIVFDDRTFIIINDNAYTVFANGTSEPTEIVIKEKPSAVAMDVSVLQYYAHNKKIYEYNLISLILLDLIDSLVDGLKKFIEPFKSSMLSMSHKNLLL